MDAELELLVNACEHCLAHRNAPPRSELHPWDWPEKPWYRIHADYAGPIGNYYFLVVVDAHSKWVEIFPTKSITSESTIHLLRTSFARWGLPVTFVSDNGPSFASREFKSYLSSMGIQQIFSAIHHPSSNGLAENAVKTFKSAVGHLEGEGSVQEKVDKYLLKSRLTPHTTTGVAPCELMLGRKVRSVFDLLKPMDTVRQKVLHQQKNQKSFHDGKKPRNIELSPDDKVIIRNYGKGSKWVPAKIQMQTGPVSYKCKTDESISLKRHQDQIWRNVQNPVLQNNTVAPIEVQPQEPEVQASPEVPTLRRSIRDRHPPVRLDL